jgi:hypothetical protein
MLFPYLPRLFLHSQDFFNLGTLNIILYIPLFVSFLLESNGEYTDASFLRSVVEAIVPRIGIPKDICQLASSSSVPDKCLLADMSAMDPIYFQRGRNSGSMGRRGELKIYSPLNSFYISISVKRLQRWRHSYISWAQHRLIHELGFFSSTLLRLNLWTMP